MLIKNSTNLQLLLQNIKEKNKKNLDKINKIKLHLLLKNKIEEIKEIDLNLRRKK